MNKAVKNIDAIATGRGDKRKPKLVGVEGWLTFFLFGLIVSVGYNIYGFISGISDTSYNTPEVIAMYPSLPTVINFENMAQLCFAVGGVYLFIKIAKRQKAAKKIALFYLSFVLIYTLVDLSIAYSMFSDNPAALEAISKSGDQARNILHALIWIPYFLVSRRVKLTLTANAKKLHGETVLSDTSIGFNAEARFAKELNTLEKVAVKLDKGCREGQIPNDTLNKAQAYLSRVADSITDSKSVGSDAYLVYEVQGLIHWAQGEEGDAFELIKTASRVKGDDVLLTQTANKIVRSRN